MRTFIICCNYNGEHTGSLAGCLASVGKNKLPDTYFAVANNGHVQARCTAARGKRGHTTIAPRKTY